MENKQKLKALLLAEQDDLQKVLSLTIPDFDAGRQLGNLIKGDEDFSDSQTLLNVKKYGTSVANYLKGAQTSAKHALRAVDDALFRMGK